MIEIEFPLIHQLVESNFSLKKQCQLRIETKYYEKYQPFIIPEYYNLLYGFWPDHPWRSFHRSHGASTQFKSDYMGVG